MASPSPNPRRRWPQFSLRTLFLLMFGVSVPLIWWSQSARRQREAVAELVAKGAYISHTHALPPMMQAGQHKPGWLESILGPDYVHHVVAVYAKESTATKEEVWRCVSRFPRLQLLYLNVDLDDDELQALAQFSGLRYLEIAGASISDSGFRHLSSLRHLDYFTLGQARVTPSLGRVIGGWPNLTHLTLSDTEVVPGALSELVSNSKLEYLSIKFKETDRAAGATDGHLREIAAIPHLEYLKLDGCAQVTDEGLVAISGLPDLYSLELRGIRPSPTKLESLQDIAGLNYLNLYGAIPSDLPVDFGPLHKALPECSIESDWGPVGENPQKAIDLPGL